MNNKPTVFISYNQSSADSIAKEIMEYLSDIAEVKRDQESIENWGSISKFMNSIRDEDFVVIIVTESYLKSSACMYEVSQFMKEKDWVDRVMFVVEDRDIYDTVKSAKYIAYWKDEEKKIRESIDCIGDVALSVNQNEKLRQVIEYESLISSFISVVADRNNPRIKDAMEAIYQRVEQAGKRIEEKKSSILNNEKLESVICNREVIRPINERFIKIFDEFMDDNLIKASRANDIRKYAEGIVDLLIKDRIVAYMPLSDKDKYQLLTWEEKIHAVSIYYDVEYAEKLRTITEVANEGENFWNDVSDARLEQIIFLANHLVDDIFVVYFTSDEHRFGTENVMFEFSMLPLYDRIYILEKVYTKVKNASVVDRLTLAYFKNDEKTRAESFMMQALKDGVINDEFVDCQIQKFNALETALSNVQAANKDFDNGDGSHVGIFVSNQLVIGFPSSKDIFDVEKAYKHMKESIEYTKEEYPEFVRMLFLILCRDPRMY